MSATIRYVILFTGTILALYGALEEFDPLTLIGAFLIVLALMLNAIINIFQKKSDQ